MTTVNHTSPPVLRSAAARPLPPQILDGITEALMTSSGAAARSDVICRLIQEMLDAVAWLDSTGADHEELPGLLQLFAVAEDHRARLSGHARPRTTSEREAS